MAHLFTFLEAPQFADEDKTRRARALNALHINMGSAMLVLGSLGILFIFREKVITTLIVLIGSLIVGLSIFFNRRGQVFASGITLLCFLWLITIFMTIISGGIRSLDIIFFVSGTVVAGIILGANGALVYALLSLLTGLGLILADRKSVV